MIFSADGGQSFHLMVDGLTPRDNKDRKGKFIDSQ